MRPNSSVLINRLLTRGKFRHVQVLLSLVELGSVQRAADAIGMTQSSVTQSLAYLESLLDMPLFLRHPRGVRPTPACLDLLPVARQIMAGIGAGAEAVAARHHAGQGVVRVFASAAAIHGLLIAALPAFHQAHPEVAIHLQEAEREGLLLAATGGEADLVVCRRPAVVPAGWRFEPLGEDHFVVVCGPQHPLAALRRVGWKALSASTWLCSPAGSAAREQFDALSAGPLGGVATHPLITRSASLAFWLLRNQPVLALLPHRFVRHLLDEGSLVGLPIRTGLALAEIGMLAPEQPMHEALARLEHFLRTRAHHATPA
jgi:DNA-binding transcriptional LysR family regulator